MTGIIIFALVAIFLGLRLYSVLGKRTGHEQGFGPAEGAAAPAPIVKANPAVEATERQIQSASNDAVAAEPGAMDGLRAIIGADRTFVPEQFVEGAASAYKMILEAYWAGDLTPVEKFVAQDVREAFEEAIAARAAAGENLDNRLIAIENAVISEAALEEGTARIVVRFDADIAAVTRNKDGAVVAGSLSDAVPTHDAWTFTRTMKSRDPNWILADTDEAA